MRIFALGGAGKICRESALDLVRFGTFDQLTIGDKQLEAAKEAAEWLNHPKVSAGRQRRGGRAASRALTIASRRRKPDSVATSVPTSMITVTA